VAVSYIAVKGGAFSMLYACSGLHSQVQLEPLLSRRCSWRLRVLMRMPHSRGGLDVRQGWMSQGGAVRARATTR